MLYANCLNFYINNIFYLFNANYISYLEEFLEIAIFTLNFSVFLNFNYLSLSPNSKVLRSFNRDSTYCSGQMTYYGFSVTFGCYYKRNGSFASRNQHQSIYKLICMVPWKYHWTRGRYILLVYYNYISKKCVY